MPWYDEFQDVVQRDVPLAPLTWLRIGGPAQFYAEPRDMDQLQHLVQRCTQEDLPVRLLGGGSNVLVRSEGLPGLVIRLTAPAFCEVRVQKNIVRSGGGAKLGHVVSLSAREGLAGLESLVGIPGTIGGALHGNAGSKAGDIGQWTRRATVMTRTGEIFQRTQEALHFAYRQSSLDELVILEGEFHLEEEDSAEITKRMQKLWIQKKASQPLAHQSAGCIFANPRGLSAGALIEQAGLKNTRIGGAQVSDRHANFIITDSTATSEDVLRLIELIRSRVLERLGVELETEIEVW